MNRNNLKEVKSYCQKIFKDNINGGIFNLFYMSKAEMKEELGINPNQINVIENLKEVKKLILQSNLIPDNIDYKIGVEGLDYLEKIEDIDELYDLGVRSVNPVWNNHNKFGTGVRTVEILNKKKGLTRLGEKLIKKLIETGIAIDLSHSDDETFWDIIKICEKHKNLKPKILASHSNCKVICDVPRNLTDEQIKSIAEFNGIIGVVGVKAFCSKDKNANFENEYVKHIIHIKKLLGNVDNIALATDDMTYYKIEPEVYKNFNVFKQEEISYRAKKILVENGFKNYEIQKISKENFLEFFK